MENDIIVVVVLTHRLRNLLLFLFLFLNSTNANTVRFLNHESDVSKRNNGVVLESVGLII
mgnify:CR=1